MSAFHYGLPQLCPRNWGAQRKFGGHAKKCSAFRAGVCAPNFRTASAPVPSHLLSRSLRHADVIIIVKMQHRQNTNLNFCRNCNANYVRHFSKFPAVYWFMNDPSEVMNVPIFRPAISSEWRNTGTVQYNVFGVPVRIYFCTVMYTNLRRRLITLPASWFKKRNCFSEFFN